jgi:hypothetical protein
MLPSPPFVAPGQYPPEALENVERAEISRQDAEAREVAQEQAKYFKLRGDKWRPYRKAT